MCGDESGETRFSRYRVTADATVRTSGVLLAGVAAEIPERVIARVCEEVGTDLRDVEIFEVDELGDT